MNAGRKPLLTIEQRARIIAVIRAKREAAKSGHGPQWKSLPTLDELAKINGVHRNTIKLMVQRVYVRLNQLDEMQMAGDAA